MAHWRSATYGPHFFQYLVRSRSSFRRFSSLERTSRPSMLPMVTFCAQTRNFWCRLKTSSRLFRHVKENKRKETFTRDHEGQAQRAALNELSWARRYVSKSSFVGSSGRASPVYLSDGAHARRMTRGGTKFVCGRTRTPPRTQHHGLDLAGGDLLAPKILTRCAPPWLGLPSSWRRLVLFCTCWATPCSPSLSSVTCGCCWLSTQKQLARRARCNTVAS